MNYWNLTIRCLAFSFLIIALGISLGCGGGSSGGGGGGESGASGKASGIVTDSTGQALEGATVYFVPASRVDTSTILNARVLDGEAEAYDEPLEDLADADGVLSATTNAQGAFSIPKVKEGKYFVWAKPAAGDTEHLPGGDLSRKALSFSFITSGNLTIVLSSSPSSGAAYVGTSTCLICHPDFKNHKLTAHAVGFKVPGKTTALQDISRYPGFDDALDSFISTDDPANGTELFYEDFDSTRGFDKFKIFEGATGGGTVYFRAYLWQDTADDGYKITLVNESNPGDTKELSVKLTYGGALYKQRFLVKVAGRKGHYPFLQYQHQGDNENYDQTRKVWRDYHADWYWDDNAGTFTDPPVTQTMEGNCAACHFTGFTTWEDGGTGEWLADAVIDVNGIDFDGDLDKEEINLGCEACHGPGSDHVNSKPRYIVNPAKLTAGRANQICGRCHDRVKGDGSLTNDQPLNSDDEMMLPGMRRADFLAEYTSRKTASGSDLWKDVDALHSKSHHQQFTDFIKSNHFRNDRELVVCSDCHTLHNNEFRHQLQYSTGPDSLLCQRCHAVDVTSHMIEQIGTSMSGSVTSCVSCHMTKTAKTGAGEMGFLLGTPSGDPATDPDIVYWENDISSHTFAVPSRFTAMGVTPGDAMPAPYTDACGICHTASQLKYLDPLKSETCGNCHADYYEQWAESGHSHVVSNFVNSTNPFYVSSCYRCHIGQQFIRENLAGDSPYSGSLPYPEPLAQTCTVCHYPHYASYLADHQLRAVGQAMVPEYGTYFQANKARMCITCHNSRTSDPAAGAVPAWSGSANRWQLAGTPHAANQSETYLGIGAVTDYSVHGFDESDISDSFHATEFFIAPGQDETQMCVTCHMHGDKKSKPHAWEPSVEACAQCHEDDSDWDEWGGDSSPHFGKPAQGDYDGNGHIESVEEEYEGLLHRIEAALTDGADSGIGSDLGFGYTFLGGHPYWDLGHDQMDPPDNDAAKAAYNFVLFEHDLAAGYHNPAYAVQVLRGTWKMLGRKLLNNPNWDPPGDDW